MEYKEQDFLQLSGLQHFAFCRRQWALIHIEQQWAENLRTVEGEIIHERAHNEDIREKRGNVISVHGLRVSSRTLGLSGNCDVVEYIAAENGIALTGYDGLWIPYPIEYKRGTLQKLDANWYQLCAQAMCLEEMLCCDVPRGAIYSNDTHHREEVQFSEDMRMQVKKNAAEMHQLYSRGYTPKVKPNKSCNACSLKEICLPKLQKTQTVRSYIDKAIKEDE